MAIRSCRGPVDLTPYRKHHPPLRSQPAPCEHCARLLDAREPVLIMNDAADELRLYCVRPECAQAFGDALPLG